MNYFTVEYGLHTSLPVLVSTSEGNNKPKAKPKGPRVLATVELGQFQSDNDATLAAASKFKAQPLRVNVLALGERRWLVLNEHELQSLSEEVA